jgi:hypothetical protein
MRFKPAGGRKTRGDKSAAPAARDEINKSGSAELSSMDYTHQIPAKRYSRRGRGRLTPYTSQKLGSLCQGLVERCNQADAPGKLASFFQTPNSAHHRPPQPSNRLRIGFVFSNTQTAGNAHPKPGIQLEYKEENSL